MEGELARTSLLTEPQRANARLMAADLFESRLHWRSRPFRLLLEANRRCNVRCRFCDIRHLPDSALPFAALERLFESLGGGLLEVLPFVGGEPTLAPIAAIARLCRRHGCWLNFITNGILFTRAYHEEVADVTSRIQFSLPSHRAGVYRDLVRGGNFDAVVQNFTDAVELARKTGTQVVTSLVLMRSNLADLAGYVDFCADLGVRRIVIQKLLPTVRAHADESVEGHVPPEVARDGVARGVEACRRRGVYLESNVEGAWRAPGIVPLPPGRFDALQETGAIVEMFRPGFCIQTAISMRVDWDGTVLPCYRDQIVLGNLHDQDFSSIWNGAPMRRLRRTFYERELRPFCRLCMAFWNGHA